MAQAVIASAVRTPIGAFTGALAGVPATELGAIAVAEAVRRADRPERVDEVLMGNVAARPGFGQNPARQPALRGGLPESVPHHDQQGLRVGAEGRGVAAQAPMAVVRESASVGVPPRVMGLGPVDAIRKALERAGVTIGDIDLFELNEAFAAQSIAVCRRLGLDEDRVNVHGGAIALGHPIGASGARVLTTLLHEMARRDARLGVAALCIGGGQGIAMVVERPEGAPGG